MYYIEYRFKSEHGKVGVRYSRRSVSRYLLVVMRAIEHVARLEDMTVRRQLMVSICQ
jgi:hypothetical protein